MFLLNTATFELRYGDQANFKQGEGYAILSHRWVGDEINFQQLHDVVAELRSGRTPSSTIQIDKIRGACKAARDLNFKWLWIDSCCIDKTNAVDLDETIRSMFKWYGGSKVCITYLSDVESTGGRGPSVFNSNERKGPSLWFTRGWTLQELLAPSNMRIYNKNWDYIGTKIDHAEALSQITGIDAEYLTGKKSFRAACVATKMSWMAGRTTTRVEDIAYSMLGIFDVHMNTRYSEGGEAFMRLQQELLTASNLLIDESLFAWRMPEPDAGAKFLGSRQEIPWQAGEWGLLAASPEWFKYSGSVTLERAPDIHRPPNDFKVARAGIIAFIPTIGKTKSEWAFQAAATWSFVGWPLLVLPRKVLPKKRGAKDFEYPLKACIADQQGRLQPVRILLRPVANGFQRIHSTEFVQGPAQRAPRRGHVEEGKILQPLLANTE
ncbi:HET-domain-containing protein [Hypoxylon argillaceum]|nr:HET-domain-containing protein [Hypoxylon argillaceum]